MLLICLDLYFTVVATRLQVFWDTFEMSYRTKKSDNKQGSGTKSLKKLIKCKRNKNRKNAKQLGGQAALLFRANIKLAEIQCKSLINRNLSSQDPLDGHCFHGKDVSWCPPTFDKVSQLCACVHACTQAPRGF